MCEQQKFFVRWIKIVLVCSDAELRGFTSYLSRRKKLSVQATPLYTKEVSAPLQLMTLFVLGQGEDPQTNMVLLVSCFVLYGSDRYSSNHLL